MTWWIFTTNIKSLWKIRQNSPSQKIILVENHSFLNHSTNRLQSVKTYSKKVKIFLAAMKNLILIVITLAVGYANNCTTPTPPSGQIPVLKNCSRTIILFPRGKFEFLNFSWPKSIWIFGILDVIYFGIGR